MFDLSKVPGWVWGLALGLTFVFLVCLFTFSYLKNAPIQVGDLVVGFRARLQGTPEASNPDSLRGTWNCSWPVEIGADQHQGPNPILDTIEFTSVTDTEVEGFGTTWDFGRYPFRGENSPYAVSIAYRGAVRPNLTGVAIFMKSADRLTEISGEWRQLQRKGSGLVGGTMRCTKAPES